MDDYDEVDPTWGEYTFQGKHENKAVSLYNNQNGIGRLLRPTSESCHIQFTHNRTSFILRNEPNLSFKFLIEGGSDAPRLRLRLLVGDISPNSLTETRMSLDVFFLPWSYHGTSTDRPQVDISRHQPASAQFTFSDGLSNLQFLTPQLPDNRRLALADLFGQCQPAQIHWAYRDPICHNFQFREERMGDGLRAAVQRWRVQIDNFKLLRQATAVHILTRRTLKLVEAYNFFVAQPVPTPPHFHRWAVRQTINEHAVADFPPLAPGTALETLFRKRMITEDDGWDSDYGMPRFTSPPEGTPMDQVVRYLDARHYEVFKMGDLVRDIAYEQEQRPQVSFNGNYEFSFKPFLTRTQVADRSYLIRLNIRCSNKAILPPPETGTTVSLLVVLTRGTAPVQFSGRLIATPPTQDEYIVTMVVTRKGGGGGFILDNHKGLFEFGSRGSPSRQMVRSIKQVMYGGAGLYKENWLKTLLLAHNPLPSYQPVPLTHRVEDYLQTALLDERQTDMFRRATHFSSELNDRLNICQGPPGAGKSHLILNLALYYLQIRKVFMVTAASNGAVNLNGERLLKVLKERNMDTDGIYRVMPDVLETLYSRPDIKPRYDEELGSEDDDDYQGLRTLDYNHLDSDLAIRLSLRAYLSSQISGTNMDEFSLPLHILARTDLVYARPPGWRSSNAEELQEHDLLVGLLDARRRLEDWTHHKTTDSLDDDAPDPVKKFDSKWLEVQKHYLERARGIFVTAAVAGSRACRVVPVQVVMMDETSQIKEVEALNAIVRHAAYGRLQKYVILGDHQQLPPTVLARMMSEFVNSTSMSIMYRFILAGYPFVMLRVQYRMHPDIVEIINKLVYKGQLQTAPSALNRPNAGLFREFLESCTFPSHRQTLWLDVTDQVTLYHERGDYSSINTAYIHAVWQIVLEMISTGISEYQILIITFYAAQRRCYQRFFRAQGLNVLVVSSVDGSQGKQADFVILDNVTPGGGPYSLGFLKDLARVNVALSRAKDGLIVVGSQTMCDGNRHSEIIQVWKDLIDHFRQNGCMQSVRFGSDTEVRTALNVPGQVYEEVKRHM